MAGHAHLPCAITRPHAGHQAVGRAVGQFHRFGFIAKRTGCQHRSEHLLLHQGVLLRHVGKQYGGHIKAARRRIGGDLSLAGGFEAIAPCRINKSLYPRQLPGVDDRAEVAVGLAGACCEVAKSLRQALDHQRIGRPLDQDTAACTAGLAGVLDDGVHQDWQGFIKIGIGKHHLW